MFVGLSLSLDLLACFVSSPLRQSSLCPRLDVNYLYVLALTSITFMSSPLCYSSLCLPHYLDVWTYQRASLITISHTSLLVTLFHGLLPLFLATESVMPIPIREAIPTLQSQFYPSSVQRLRYQSTMANPRQLLRILRLSLLLNLIHFSMSLQSNSLHQSQHQVLYPEDVGFFHPDVPDIHGPGPVVMVGSDMVYRDIYTWVEILNERADILTDIHITEDITQVIQPCLRGSAAIWWIVELTGEERQELRKANLQRWSAVLIERFGLPLPIAQRTLYSLSYTRQDLHQSPRIYIHQMVQYAKAAKWLPYFLLQAIWEGFEPELRMDISQPTTTTTLTDFIDRVDHSYRIWLCRNKGIYGGFAPPEFHDLGLSSVELQLPGLFGL